MIVAMKKVFLLIQESKGHHALERLQELGMLHVEQQSVPSGPELNEINEKLNFIEAARSVLSGVSAKQAVKKIAHKPEDCIVACRHIIDLQKRYDQLREYAVSLNSLIGFWEHWGDFDPAQIKALQQENIYLRFFQIPRDKIKNLPPDVIVKEIAREGSLINCLVASLSNMEIGFKELELPKLSLSQAKSRLAENSKIMQDIREELSAHLIFQDELISCEESLLHQKEFYSVLRGMGKEGEFVYLKGYIPVDTEKELIRQARINNWGLLTLDPAENDNVPTLMRNPRWISVITPVFKFLEILPGYRELDVSLPFLVFFSIFFGMLIGDAGYGLVYLLLTFLVQRKLRKKEPAFFLFYILSSCAIIWGLLTGTFFGQEWFLKAGYKPLMPILNSEKGLQQFCFFLGAVHLSIAHGWRAILKAPSLNALADIGSICVLWSVFFIIKTLIFGDSFPQPCLWLFICGASLIIIFTNPQKNFFKYAEEWIAWLITLPFTFIGNFADVVSYIRLFAVGMAGVAVADAFNAMASMIGQGGLFMIIPAVFVALVGNALGIVLGPVSVLVHGVRLNVLEFSGHMGLSWSGVAYNPLKD